VIAGPYAPSVLADASLALSLSVPRSLVLWVVVLLVLWVVAYFLYRMAMTKRRDFGMPVRRRLLCRSLKVRRDEVAEVPFWWTDLQVQHALGTHWRYSLRSPFLPPPEY
jgi:hypothetical protein